MKNKAFIITLAVVLFATFALAPAANALVAPILIALPLAGLLSIFGFSFQQQVALQNNPGDAVALKSQSGGKTSVTEPVIEKAN